MLSAGLFRAPERATLRLTRLRAADEDQPSEDGEVAMRALVCRRWCEFRELEIDTIDAPVAGPGQVLIDVHYAGVGFAHSLVVAGKYQVKPPHPFVPGTELSGVVRAVGAGVDHVRSGDPVIAIVDWGAFASQALAPAATVYRMPVGADLAAALHLATSYSTAYAALVWRARLQAGETLLVHGAGGALGLAAVEIGRILGARVIACASSDAKRNMACERGASLALPSSGFRDVIKQQTAGRGADVVFDPVGGDVFDESLRAVAQEGRILPVGFAAGRIPQVPANLVLVKNLQVLGMYFGMYVKEGMDGARERHAPRVQAMMRTLIGWMQEGRLHPTVYRIYALDEFAQAMDAVLERRSIGKVLLSPDGVGRR